MKNNKEKTAFNPSIGADERQPIQKIAENSISANSGSSDHAFR